MLTMNGVISSCEDENERIWTQWNEDIRGYAEKFLGLAQRWHCYN